MYLKNDLIQYVCSHVLLKFTNRNAQQKNIYSKSTIDTIENNKDGFIDVVLVFLLSTLNIFHTFSSVSIVDLEQVIVCWLESHDWK